MTREADEERRAARRTADTTRRQQQRAERTNQTQTAPNQGGTPVPGGKR
jgi:hypothetical protein